MLSIQGWGSLNSLKGIRAPLSQTAYVHRFRQDTLYTPLVVILGRRARSVFTYAMINFKRGGGEQKPLYCCSIIMEKKIFSPNFASYARLQEVKIIDFLANDNVRNPKRVNDSKRSKKKKKGGEKMHDLRIYSPPSPLPTHSRINKRPKKYRNLRYHFLF